MANIYNTEPGDTPPGVGPLPDQDFDSVTGLSYSVYPVEITDFDIDPAELVPGHGPLVNIDAANAGAYFVFGPYTPAFDPILGLLTYELYFARAPREDGIGTAFVVPSFNTFVFLSAASQFASAGVAIPATTVSLPGSLDSGPYFVVGRITDRVVGNSFYTAVKTLWIDKLAPPDNKTTPASLLNAFGDLLTDLVVGASTSVLFTVPTYKQHKAGDTVEVRFGNPTSLEYQNDPVKVAVSAPGVAGAPITIELPVAFLKKRVNGDYQIDYRITDAAGNVGPWSRPAPLTTNLGAALVLPPLIVVRAEADNLVDRADAYQPQGTEVRILANPAFLSGTHSFQLYVGVNGAPVAAVGAPFRFTGQEPILGYLPAATLQALYDATGAKGAVPLEVQYALMSGTREAGRSTSTVTTLDLFTIGPVITPPDTTTNRNLNAPHLTGPVSLLPDTLEARDQGGPVTVTIVAWTVPDPSTPAFYVNLFFGSNPTPFRSPLQSGIAAGGTISFPVPSSFFERAGNGNVPLFYNLTAPGLVNASAYSPSTPVNVSGWSKRLGGLRFDKLFSYTPPIISCPALQSGDTAGVFKGRLLPSEYYTLNQVATVEYRIYTTRTIDPVTGVVTLGGPSVGPFTTTTSPATQADLTGGIPFSIRYADVKAKANGFMEIKYRVVVDGETIESPPIVIQVQTNSGRPCPDKP